MTTETRERLPNRRGSVNLDFEIWGLRFSCTHSNYSDGCLAELFIDNHKAGSQVGTLVRDAAVAASLALQHGCPAETLRGAVLRNPDGSAASALGAALDLIAKDRGAS